jgi:antitoxin component YwqK of YwqJK toxin-antitoxin module
MKQLQPLQRFTLLSFFGLIVVLLPLFGEKETDSVIKASQQPVYVDGLYFTDQSQTELFTGYYREYYESGELKLDVFLFNGRPEGTFVVYFPNARIKEVRAYRKGVFHGVWRTYNDSGMLISQAEYANGLKDGAWMIWDENGIRRYEMHYRKGEKTGIWYMWDDKGVLISEKVYSSAP